MDKVLGAAAMTYVAAMVTTIINAGLLSHGMCCFTRLTEQITSSARFSPVWIAQ